MRSVKTAMAMVALGGVLLIGSVWGWVVTLWAVEHLGRLLWP